MAATGPGLTEEYPGDSIHVVFFNPLKIHESETFLPLDRITMARHAPFFPEYPSVNQVSNMQQSRLLITYLVLFGILLLWSAINPKDYLLWVLEVAPAIAGIALCVFFYRRQPFTTITYTWCFIAAGLMTIGAHYSYSEVPLFDLIQDKLNSDRNNYDKLGHFVQGILPVLISQEVLIRNRIVHSTRWINFLSVCVALTVAAVYELIEWSAILFSNETQDNFLGMQGYAWDAQSDMLYALAGAVLTLFFTGQLRQAIEKSAGHAGEGSRDCTNVNLRSRPVEKPDSPVATPE